MEIPHSMVGSDDEEVPEVETAAEPAEPPPSGLHRIGRTVRNRWPEYVIEAFVIVFSISLSFAMETWRESRHTGELEQLYLRTLSANLRADIGSLEGVAAETQQVLAGARDLTVLTAANPDFAARFHKDMELVIQRPSFLAHDAAFANLRSGGGLQAIRDFELKNALFDYYREVDSIRATEAAEREVLISVIGPFLLRNMPLQAPSASPVATASIRRILGTTEFQNDMWVRIQNRSELLDKYQRAQRSAEAVRSRIKL